MKLTLRALRRRFTSQIDNFSNAFENSNFLSKTRNPRNFIAKLKAKARVDCLDERQKDLSYKLSQPDVWNDSKLATDLSLELATIRGKLTEITDFELALSDVTEMYHMALEDSNAGSSNREIVDECFSIINQMEIDIESRGIIDLMVGKYDEIGSCFLQINAGAGGTEACDWVGMIYRMYRNYCKLNELVLEVVDENANDETANVGYRTITLRVKGLHATCSRHVMSCHCFFWNAIVLDNLTHISLITHRLQARMHISG
jgi:protein subunit release factor A